MSNFESSSFFGICRREREAIDLHKWYASEKAGYDIGFERALLDWVRHYRRSWIKSQEEFSSISDYHLRSGLGK